MQMISAPALSDPNQAASPEVVLDILSKRFSCREFDSSEIDQATLSQIVNDGLQAPSSCNHQNWHFVIVTEPEIKRRARDISGGNHHFEFCSALIYLCFQKGWTHDNFSIVQSVSAACYHMVISAHLRGLSSIWNAGIGDKTAIADMLGIPPTFEIQGALCVGRAKPTAPQMKAPRRPEGEVFSFGRFNRPSHAVYPAKPAPAYPYFAISGRRNPFAEWRPATWGWDRVSDFRGYAVWAKSPIAGVYQSRRQGDATNVETALVGAIRQGETLVDVLPWGGTHTAVLAATLPEGADLKVAELSDGNLVFIKERLRQEGYSGTVDGLLMKGGAIPLADASVDVVTIFQTLEHMPDPARFLDEVRRILKPGGRAVVTARNMNSLFGLNYRREMRKGQVPNQGPFEPLPARQVRRMLAERFTIIDEAGISLRTDSDATVYRGRARFFCRLYTACVTKAAQ